MNTVARRPQAQGTRIAERAGAPRRMYVMHLVFVNGLASDRLDKNTEERVINANPAGRVYWDRGFVQGAMEYYGLTGSVDSSCTFTNEPFGFLAEWHRSGTDYIDPMYRRQLGYRAFDYWAGKNFGITDKSTQTLAIITHSMGAAYSMGLMERLRAEDYGLSEIVHINPFQPRSDAVSAVTFGFTVHVQTDNDFVVKDVPWWAEFLVRLKLGPLPGGTEHFVKQAGWIEGAKPISRPGPDNPLEAHYWPIGQGRDFWFPGGRRAHFGHEDLDEHPWVEFPDPPPPQPA